MATVTGAAKGGFFSNKKIIWAAVVFLLLIIAAGWYWWARGHRKSPDYLTVAASKGSIVEAVSASGKIEALHSIGLSFKNPGTIKAIYVKEGQSVKAGQLLALQDATDLELQVKQAQANLDNALARLQSLQAGPLATDVTQAEASVEQAQAEYDNAQDTLKRNQALYDAGALSEIDLNNARKAAATAAGNLKKARAALEALKNGSRPEDIAAAQAQVEAARAQLELARNNLAATEIRAPWDGIVTNVNGQAGQRVGSNTSATDPSNSFIFLISPELQLRVQVNEADINKVKVGQDVEFTVNAMSDRTFNGKVAAIAPQAQTVSNIQLYDVLVNVGDGGASLKAGETASVTIIINRKDNVITIPRAAIAYAQGYLSRAAQSAGGRATSSGRTFSGGNPGGRSAQGTVGPATGIPSNGTPRSGENQAVILVLEGGQPVKRQVVTGASDERNIEVVSGLTAGEQVVVGTGSAGNTSSTGNTGSTGRANSGGNRTGGPQQPVMFFRGR
ncbi:HlyD family efflux transporter periplasmic adaptor subunit [Desulfofundulus thermobenzoicus]|uniref:HlyD family efflux transporter periplasmic adaptor subunit n=1 Tax=Desulfofundulus thermobenzoicus TaxID=29376 RepID=A0A6N7IQQ8_9FIRM|nr:efflux RND transporter periplasmic adaptor subunit [Desulfofundulus thermobenzoicus]MQL51867.1 HlyD family efflux transporter periplasmic adaptor subunit [Desulfofundulus thermobenzoicus]